jgi:ABC-2 type transport system ATP-binding protein
MIEIQNVTKRYGTNLAVDDVTFTINEGEVLGFLGRNGAGKSTTMNIVTGYISASSGRVLVDGMDILEEPREAKRHIGYLPEQPPLYMDMTVEEYLRFVCDIKEIRRQSQKAHLEDIYELVRIQEVRRRLIKNLSKGYKQRVGLAQALVGNPDVIIMDEPTVGLDPRQIIEIRRLIRDLGKSHTVVLSSHILHEVSDVCDRVVIINRGKIVAQDSLENLTKGIGEGTRMMLRVVGAEKPVQRLLRELPGVSLAEPMGVKEPGAVDFMVESQPGNDVRRQLGNALVSGGYPILMLQPMAATLEDIFLQLTNESAKEE